LMAIVVSIMTPALIVCEALGAKCARQGIYLTCLCWFHG
jgi:hypothetical protein